MRMTIEAENKVLFGDIPWHEQIPREGEYIVVGSSAYRVDRVFYFLKEDGGAECFVEVGEAGKEKGMEWP